MTLVFLGVCSAATEARLVAGANGIDVSHFDFDLTQIGYWRRPRVLWCAADNTSPAQQDLVDRLQCIMVQAGLQPERREYQPHVTLARKIQAWNGQDEIPPVRWAARDFCLVHSASTPQGVRYEVIQKWPLHKPAA